MQANTITSFIPDVIEPKTNPTPISTTLLESLTSYTVDYCLKDLQSSVNSYFKRKREQLPGLVKSLLYTKNEQPEDIIEGFFSRTELIVLQKEIQQKIWQRMDVLGPAVATDRVEITVIAVNFSTEYLTELVTDLKFTLKTFSLAKKLGDKGLEMVTKQVKLDRIKLFSVYLEKTWFEQEQAFSRCEEKLMQCLLGVCSVLEEQVTEQLTCQVVDKIYNWFDSYVSSLAS